MKKRIAVLDLGTNTFHLLIAELQGGKLHKVLEAQKHVKLGEGGINKGEITEAAFGRGIEALHYFKTVMDASEVDDVKGVGTAALRSARNGQAFIRAAKELGITIEIIDGEQEAALIYQGVRASVALNECSLIMDIGGGSVEFIIGNQQEIFWKKSFPVGAARLMESFHHHDPISTEEIVKIKHYLDAQLSELKEALKRYCPETLVGSAGAFETFAALAAAKFNSVYTTEADSFDFEREELLAVIDDILSSTHEERAANQLILPVRVDMIVVAAVLTSYILGELSLPGIKMSRFALKEGLFFSATGF